MKEIIWYLPSGSGGMAAQHKSYLIREAIVEWGEQYVPGINLIKQLTFYSENGLRYYSLQLKDKQATVFALTWDNNVPKLHYEYIKPGSQDEI